MDIQSSFTVYTAALHALILNPLLLAYFWLGLSWTDSIDSISANKRFSSFKTSSRKPYSNSKQQEKQKHSAENTINFSLCAHGPLRLGSPWTLGAFSRCLSAVCSSTAGAGGRHKEPGSQPASTCAAQPPSKAGGDTPRGERRHQGDGKADQSTESNRTRRGAAHQRGATKQAREARSRPQPQHEDRCQARTATGCRRPGKRAQHTTNRGTGTGAKDSRAPTPAHRTHSQWVAGPARAPERTGGWGWKSARPRTPHTQARGAPPGRSRAAPTARKASSQKAHSGVGDGSPPPHPPHPQPVGSGPRPHAPKDGMTGSGERPTPNAPHPGKRRPPRAPW